MSLDVVHNTYQRVKKKLDLRLYRENYFKSM